MMIPLQHGAPEGLRMLQGNLFLSYSILYQWLVMFLLFPSTSLEQ